MTYPNCTPEAEQLFASLIESGQVINCYSDEYANEDGALIESDNLAEYDDEHGTEYRNHLLIYFCQGGDDAIQALTELYPALNASFDEGVYPTRLLFLNLASQKALCVGIARRGNIFETYYDLQAGTKEEGDEDFFAMDYSDVGGTLINALAELATANYNLWSEEVDEGLLQDALDRGPDEDGLYYYEEDDEGMTLDDIREQQNRFEELGDEISDAIDTISQYFPKLEITNDDFVTDE